MQDDLDRTAESPTLSSRAEKPRLTVVDAASAIALAEVATGARVFGEPDHAAAADELLAACRDAAERGERVAAVARIEAFGASRASMRRIAQARVGFVAHALASHGAEELGALADLGWGLLCASGPEDSFDLALIARRAAEDAGVPFLVVHGLGVAGGAAGRAVMMAALPQERSCQAFVGAQSRLRPRHDEGHPALVRASDRTFGERLPFALGSALRDYAAISGRRHDTFHKAPMGESPIVLVGLGAVGEALTSAAADLRGRGYDVGAVHVTALRPFPGARLVKALARALAVTVLEPADEPLGHGGLLARELKAAFTDALTWVPGFPGIGRIPKLFVGATGPSIDLADLAAVCDNMLADERGRRSFSFVETEHTLARPRLEPAAGSPSIRAVLDDAASADIAVSTTAAALAGALGLRAHGIVAPRGAGATVDILAARDGAGGGMIRRAPKLVIATMGGASASEAVAKLEAGSVLAVLTDGDGQGVLPEAARAIVRERRARALSLPLSPVDGDVTSALAAACAGAALAAASRGQRAPLEGALVAEVVREHLGSRGVAAAESAGERARRAYEATSEALAAAERESGGDAKTMS